MSSVRFVVRPVIILVLLLVACGLAGCTGAGGHEATVTVLGSWTGTEEDGFLAMVRGFEHEYDNRIQVNYIGTRDAPAVLANDLKNGDLPDLAVLATPGVMHQYAAEGALRPDQRGVEPANHEPAVRLELAATHAGNWRTGSKAYYAIIVKAALKSVIWYDPNQFPASYRKALTSNNLTWNQLMGVTEHLAAAGVTPWCIGMADSSNSGWPGTDWIEDIVLHQSGLEVYDRWVDGKLAWTSAPITQAFQAFGQVAVSAVTRGLVHGGTPSELETSYATVGQPMFYSSTGLLPRPRRFIHHRLLRSTTGSDPQTPASSRSPAPTSASSCSPRSHPRTRTTSKSPVICSACSTTLRRHEHSSLT